MALPPPRPSTSPARCLLAARPKLRQAPKMNGLQLTDALRRNPRSRDIPIVILSGQELSSEEKLALRGSVQAFAAKDGFSLEGFTRELRRLEGPAPGSGKS